MIELRMDCFLIWPRYNTVVAVFCSWSWNMNVRAQNGLLSYLTNLKQIAVLFPWPWAMNVRAKNGLLSFLTHVKKLQSCSFDLELWMSELRKGCFLIWPRYNSCSLLLTWAMNVRAQDGLFSYLTQVNSCFCSCSWATTLQLLRLGCFLTWPM